VEIRTAFHFITSSLHHFFKTSHLPVAADRPAAE
jgi:hypothetical protein